MVELEALPPDLRDLPRFCHPRLQSQSQNRRGSDWMQPPRPGLAPEVSAQVASLQSPTLCSGQAQCKPARNPLPTLNSEEAKKLPPIHPGKILLEDMKDEEISINGLAQAIRVPANRISLIVNQKRGITADTAARLGRYFGTSAQYWLNIQNRFDLDSIDQSAIERDVIPKRTA